MILGINASRARSGGAISHLKGILTEVNPERFGFNKVHVWSYPRLLDELPSSPWLIKHAPAKLGGSIYRQLLWERFSLPSELEKANCDLLFNVDAGTLCRFRPSVTLSQDMLSYERGEMGRYGLSKARLRLLILRYLQNQSLRHANGVIFLTSYAATTIQQSCGQLKRVALVPHGVDLAFTNQQPSRPWPSNENRPLNALYVSNVAPYKHQWHVVRAISLLRKKGFDIYLILTGGGRADGASVAQKRLDKEIETSDPNGLFTRQLGFVPHDELPQLLASADLFVYASTCENMPITLLEAMAVGLPITCSSRGPMEEVLGDGGIYFDPENVESISAAIEKMISDDAVRARAASRAKLLAEQYSWARCADETFSFLEQVGKNSRLNGKSICAAS